MICKANPAAYVFVIMPIYKAEESRRYACITVYVLVHQGKRGVILLACLRRIGVIILTYEDQDPNGQNPGSSPQRDTSSTTGNIQDRLFLEESFFDPQDLMQVRYEMLRRVQKDEMPISTVAASFGVSRPALYKAQRDFARGGLAGLIPRRRGPKQGHKLTGRFSYL